MADQPVSPVLVKPIPPQIVNEGASFGPLNLFEFIVSPNQQSGDLYFQAELSTGQSLPKGLICTGDGILTGIPAGKTQGSYTIRVTADNDSNLPFTTQFDLLIKPHMMMEGELFGDFKSKIWQALVDNLPLPEMGDILDRPISAIELYYLLQRFAILTVWDVYNLEMPSNKQLLQLEGVSKHYNVYDRGSCLVGAPKDLFSHERTLEDALQTSRAMAREVYNRGWTIELSGFNKMIRGAWVELQHLGDKHGRHIDILRYDPTADDLKIYVEQAKVLSSSSGMEM